MQRPGATNPGGSSFGIINDDIVLCSDEKHTLSSLLAFHDMYNPATREISGTAGQNTPRT